MTIGDTSPKSYPTAIVALLDQDFSYFDVSAQTGFLDNENTATRLLTNLSEYAWETTLLAGQGLAACDDSREASQDEIVKATGFRKLVHEMPVIRKLSAAILNDKGLLRRSYVVLCMLGNTYMHAARGSEVWDLNDTSPRIQIVPKSIAVPWLTVSEILGVQPILCYASEILWNCRFSSCDSATAEQVEILETFTGHESEIAFCAGAARVELEGAAVLRAIFSCLAIHLRSNDVNEICIGSTKALEDIRVALIKMKQHITTQMREADPQHFYWTQRPWIAGTGVDGWNYELDNGMSKILQFSGSTAGATALFQLLDVFLGVDAPSEQQRFREKMRGYMPKQHRELVQTVAALRDEDVIDSRMRGLACQTGCQNGSVLRRLAQNLSHLHDKAHGKEIRALLVEYNAVLQALEEFRASHFQLVTLFIINQARKGRAMMEDAPSTQELRGTGGSDMASLLKGYRTASKEARVTFSRMETVKTDLICDESGITVT